MTQIKRIKVLLFIFCFCSCKKAEKTDYVFPLNYNGWAIVFYNVKNEKKFEERDNRTEVQIPQNGILFTSNKRPEGVLDNRYLFKSKNGKYNKIYPSLSSISKNDTISSYVLVKSYQSLKINKSYYLNKSINNRDEWVSYDEIVIFKIANGFSDTIVTKKDVDKYLDSIKKQIIK
jgi:hypothetical protein